MGQRHQFVLLGTTALLLCGCTGKKAMPTPNAQAAEQWNAARANAMTGLAAEQLRDGSFDKCEATLDQLLRLTPNDANLHLLAAKLFLEEGRLELVDAHLAEARKLAPANAEADYLTGQLMERWQQPERAQDAYADAAGKDPNEVAYLLAEAEMLVALKKPTDALALLQSKLDHFDHNGVLRQEIGLLQAATGQNDEAIASLRDACRLSPDDATIREHLAFTLFQSGQYAEAGDVFDRLGKRPDYAGRADVFAALGECMGRTQRYAEAQKAYATATTLDATTPGYWLGLSRTALQAGDVPTADLAVRRAANLRPADGATQCLLGYVRLKQDQLPQALAAFHAAAEFDPKDSTALCLEGYVLARTGRTAEARDCFARAQARQPGNPLADRLLASGLTD